ncbi:MAG: hypothetical protein JJU06_10375 [Ectothiorhodospiraceae bacterium]|nr:hypothetical protein [Ectothiorhodospiraceae bacterium]
MAVREDIFNEGALRIEKVCSGTELALVLSGKSIIREANETLLPVFVEGLREADEAGFRLVLDFRPVTYMNSSSFAPVIKVLQKARLSTVQVSVIFSSEQKWQEVSFAAMTVFKTPDGRITITGLTNEQNNN